MAIPGELDAIANIAITLYGNGGLEISGNIADVRLALQMMDHAREAIAARLDPTKRADIVIPNKDVVVKPTLPLTYYGDAPSSVKPELVRQARGGIR